MFLVTGAAGFVGSHVVRRLLSAGYHVVGLDSINDYYDRNLKLARLKDMESENFSFFPLDISNASGLSEIFQKFDFSVVINLAAQAGVRYSVTNPGEYTKSNLVGFYNVLEMCRQHDVDHLIYASSSSVYGECNNKTFSEGDCTDFPLGYYAATKKSNELMAHSYASLFGFSVTGLRFFSVYGEWGRPDMAYYKFAKNIMLGRSIDVYGGGDLWRDFTYVGDVAESVYRLALKSERGLVNIFNVGRGRPTRLGDMVDILQNLIGRSALINNLPKPSADVTYTSADVGALTRYIDFAPNVDLEFGLGKFVEWLNDYSSKE